jgi:hypothetical protein
VCARGGGGPPPPHPGLGKKKKREEKRKEKERRVEREKVHPSLKKRNKEGREEDKKIKIIIGSCLGQMTRPNKNSQLIAGWEMENERKQT